VGRSEIVEYQAEKTAGNRKMQGALYYPAGYVAGKSYPMIVSIYETLSDGVHRYVAPNTTNYYNTSVFTTQGYFVLQPGHRLPSARAGHLGRRVRATRRRGRRRQRPRRSEAGRHHRPLVGGFDTAFLATHTQGTPAAAVAGAAITDLISNYGNGHWSSGILETDHIETGSSGWRCRSGKICRPTSGIPRCSTCRT
jgi:hypothetical protein